MSVKNIRPYIPSIIVLLAFVILGVFITRNVDRLVKLFQLSYDRLLLLAFLALISSLFNGWVNHLLYTYLGLNIPFLSSYGLATVNTLANQLPLSGGLFAKGIYLKRKFDLPYTKYFSATIALFIVFLATNGTIGLTLLNVFHWSMGTPSPFLINFGFGLMITSIFLLWIPLQIAILPEKWRGYLRKMNEGWLVLKKNQILLISLIGVQLLAILTMGLRFWLAFRFFAQEMSFHLCILYASATILTRLVSIIPGGIGVREGIVAGMAAVFGFEPGVSVIAIGLDRLVSTIVVAILGTGFTYLFSKQLIQRPTSETD